MRKDERSAALPLAYRLAVALCMALFLPACGTPQKPTANPATMPAPTARPQVTLAPSHAAPTVTPSPASTPVRHFSLVITQEPLQYWSDPNDVSGLVYDGAFLWAATPAGVVRWSLQGEAHLFAMRDGLASQAVRGIALDGEGHVWVGYMDHEGWSRYEDGAWHTFTTREEAVEAHYEAMRRATHHDPHLWANRPDGERLWLPTVDGMVKSYDGSIWRTYGPYSGVTRDTWLVAVSGEGRVWAIGRGVSTVQEGRIWWDDHTFFSSIVDSHYVTDIAADSGGVWLAFEGPPDRGGGVCRLDWAANLWRGYLQELNPAIPYQVYGVDVERDGSIWVCGREGLAYRLPTRPWRLLGLDDAEVRCFVQDEQGTLWLGTTRGIWRKAEADAAPQGPWLLPSPILGSEIRDMLLDAQGRLWLGTSNGLSYIAPDGQAGIVTEEGVLSLALDPVGNVWMGSESGLYEVDEERLQKQFDRAVLDVAFRDGIPWVCTLQGDLIALGPGGAEIKAHLADLAGVLPREMAIDSGGTVWLATERGLGSLSAEGDWQLATVEDGLLSEDVRAIALDVDDTLWMATARGLARRRADGRWTRFTTESTEGGLRSMEMWDVTVDAAGVLWMATTAGISRRLPEHADWSYYDLPEARRVLVASPKFLWVATESGLYRLDTELLIAVP